MKSWLGFLLLVGCAQPTSLRPSSGTNGGRRDGGGLVFDDGGTPEFEMPDLAGARAPDLSAPPDLAGAPDLALPAGVDLAMPPGADLATVPDLAHASVENCFNNLDDDGNGKINDGCPDTITTGPDVPLTAGGGAGGGAVSAHCPANQVVIAQSFVGDDYDGWMAGVAIWCSPVTLVRGTSSYSVQLTAPSGMAAGYFQGGGNDYYEQHSCDTTAFQVAWSVPMFVSSYVNGFFLDCGAGTLTLSPANQLTIAFTNHNDKFGFQYGGGSALTDTCGSDSAIVGYNGRDGAWLDQLQPICAKLVVNYK